MKRAYYLQINAVTEKKMTEGEAIRIIEEIKRNYVKNNNREEARNRLHSVFSECFNNKDNMDSALSYAYALLRHVENNTPAPPFFPFSYDITLLTEGLVFCAQTVFADTEKRFILNCGQKPAFVNLEPESLCRIILSLLANAFKYSDTPLIKVKLCAFKGFVSVTVTNSGCFEADRFQKALSGNGSLGFVFRTLRNSGGSAFMTEGAGSVSVAIKIPVCDSELPCIIPSDVEDMLFDRLSVLYVSFCGH